jgi:hypothetical protein
MTSAESELFPPSLQKLLDLFATGPLAKVHFPDIDGPALAKLAEAVKQHGASVTEAEQRVVDARAAFTESLETLRIQAQRALSYARIYADGQPAVRPLLDGIDLSRSAAPPTSAPKRRGRPPKANPSPEPTADERGAEFLQADEGAT